MEGYQVGCGGAYLVMVRKECRSHSGLLKRIFVEKNGEEGGKSSGASLTYSNHNSAKGKSRD